MSTDRMMPRGLPNWHNAAKSKSDSEIETSIPLGSEREGNEEAAAGEEAIEGAIVILIGVRHETQGHHHLLDAEARPLAFVNLHYHVRLIHTFHPAVVVAVQMIGGADHLLLEGRLLTRVPHLGAHHVEDTRTTSLQDHAADIAQAGLEHLHAGIMAGIEIIEFRDVVMIVQDPIHLQIPLAHVRPDEFAKDVPPLCHLEARHRLHDLEIIAENGIGRLRRALAH